MKAVEVHNLEDPQLVEFADNARQEVFNLRFQHATGQLENTARLRQAKKDLARALTVANQVLAWDLLAGPNEDDADHAEVDQLTTRIPAETELRQVVTDASDPSSTIAYINLGCAPDAVDPTACGLLGFSGTDQAIMMGQFACTVSNIDGVDAVSFLHEGQPQPASLADGTTTTNAVRCSDYRDLTSGT